MECAYTYNGKDTRNILELAKVFYQSKTQLDPSAAIYSSEEVQKSTVDILLEQNKLKTQIEENKNLSPVTDFIVSTNSAPILNGIGIDAERLAPEYIEENRINNYISTELDKNTSLSIDESKLPKVSKERFDKVLQKFPNSDKSVLQFYLSQIEDIIKLEELTKDFGNALHELISISIKEEAGLNSSLYKNRLSTLITENPDIFGVGLEKEWEYKIAEIVKSITSFVLKTGTPITELTLMSGKNDRAQLKGRIDLIAVDGNGNAHIFDIKISKKPYEEWDDVKLLTLDWQLALYRQLLSKHIDVKNTLLYVLPIQLENLKDPKSLHYIGSDNRRNNSKSGLIEGGKLTMIARLLIPNSIHRKYNEKKEAEFLSDLEGVLPSYKIKTTRDTYDVDKIVERAKQKGEFSFYNKFHENPDFSEKYITADTEKEFREKIEKFVEYAKLQQNINVIRLKDAINAVILDPSKTSIELPNKRQSIIANKMFKNYLSGNWEILDGIPESTNLGLIVLRNTFTNTIDVISLSTYEEFADYTEVSELKYGDLEYIKTFLFLNNFKEELFLGRGNKIGTIRTYNPDKGTTYFKDTRDGLTMFSNRMLETGRKGKISLNEKTHLVSFEKTALANVQGALQILEGETKNQMEAIFSGISGSNLNDVDLDKLLEINKAFLKLYPEYKDKEFQATLNFGDRVEYLYTLLQVAILSKHGVKLSADFVGMSNHAFHYADFKSLISALFTKEQSEYDAQGRKISGIMGGLTQITPDFVRSNDLRNINQIIANVNSKIGQKMVEQSYNIHALTKKYYDEIGYKGISRSWYGESQSKYKHLFVLDPNTGDVSKEFKTKNPYIINSDNALSEPERTFLKGILFEIQKYALALNSNDINKINPQSLDSLMSNEKVAKAIKSGEYFKMPLIRREEFSRNKEFLKGGLHGFWVRFKERAHEFNDLIDPRELDPEELKYINESAVGFTEMYDVYGRQTESFKNKMIEKNGSTYYEWNLDTIAHRMAFNKIRKQQFDAKLPIINAYVWWLKLQGGQQNKDVEKVLTYIENQLKLAAFDEPIIDDEFADVAKTTAAIKKITTGFMLAFRPVLFVKEITIGIMKGVGLAATQIYGKDQFGVGDLTSAYGKLLTIDNKFSDEFNLIDNINNYYRFANMDINTIAKKLQSDRKGVMRGMGRWMYSMNTIPDYYNRLSLFLAKMIHDGSYDAHIMVDGKMTYDPRKDKRFEHYFNLREKYKNSKGDYIPAPSDKEYNKQRNLYLLLVEEINTENAGTGENKLTEADLVSKAYSEKERNSFKSFTDMAYGYYDKDSQSQLNNTWYGMIWLQFMQFWPGKMKQWFGKPVEGKNSPIGKFKHKTRIEDGKEVLLYKKPIYREDEPDVIERFEEVTEDTGDPVYEWEGSPQEGLIYSALYTLHDVLTGNFKDLKANSDRNRRVLFAFHDAILMMFIWKLFKAFIDNYILENGTDGIDGKTMAFYQSVTNKVFSETNMFQSTIAAVDATPAFLSFGSRVAKDMQDILEGHGTVQELLGHNVGALEFLKS